MSIWSTIGGIAMIGGGLVTANPGLVTAGAGVLGSGIASDQVSKAAKKQQQATDQGLALQQQINAQNQARLDPYIQLGNGAVGNLRGLIGMNVSAPSNVDMNAVQNAAALGRAAATPLQPQYYGDSPQGWADYVHRKMAEVKAQQDQSNSGYGVTS